MHRHAPCQVIRCLLYHVQRLRVLLRKLFCAQPIWLLFSSASARKLVNSPMYCSSQFERWMSSTQSRCDCDMRSNWTGTQLVCLMELGTAGTILAATVWCHSRCYSSRTFCRYMLLDLTITVKSFMMLHDTYTISQLLHQLRFRTPLARSKSPISRDCSTKHNNKVSVYFA